MIVAFDMKTSFLFIIKCAECGLSNDNLTDYSTIHEIDIYFLVHRKRNAISTTKWKYVKNKELLTFIDGIDVNNFPMQVLY